jgi:hypothetical protein
MPIWAQWVGGLLPATYFLRVLRGILLKGNDWVEILPNIWPLLTFLFVEGWVALLRYRETLDQKGRNDAGVPFLRDWTAISWVYLRTTRGLLGPESKRIFRPLIGRETIPKGGAL